MDEKVLSSKNEALKKLAEASFFESTFGELSHALIKHRLIHL